MVMTSVGLHGCLSLLHVQSVRPFLHHTMMVIEGDERKQCGDSSTIRRRDIVAGAS
jgi:hypothetical protein